MLRVERGVVEAGSRLWEGERGCCLIYNGSLPFVSRQGNPMHVKCSDRGCPTLQVLLSCLDFCPAACNVGKSLCPWCALLYADGCTVTGKKNKGCFVCLIYPWVLYCHVHPYLMPRGKACRQDNIN